MRSLLIILCLLITICCKSTQIQSDTSYIVPASASDKTENCTGKPTVIAVIDTGFGAGWEGEEKVKLCKFGHRNFVDNNNSDKFGTSDPVPLDIHGHGTHIASIIDAFGKAGHINYCIVILRYFDDKAWGQENLIASVRAIKYAKNIGADFINYSGGGDLPDSIEAEAVKEYLDAGGKFIAAAGNNGANIDYRGYYPAQEDDRIIVVGNLLPDGVTHSKTSNYGKRVNRWEIGTRVVSLNMSMSGTSQATAVATGKLVVQTKNTCK